MKLRDRIRFAFTEEMRVSIGIDFRDYTIGLRFGADGDVRVCLGPLFIELGNR